MLVLLRARVYVRVCARGAGRAGWLDGVDWWDGWLGWLVGWIFGCGVARCLRAGLVDWRVGCHAHLTHCLQHFSV